MRAGLFARETAFRLLKIETEFKYKNTYLILALILALDVIWERFTHYIA